jgi:hypothetical protein
LDEIRDAITQIGRRIAAPDNMLPTYGSSLNIGLPHIEVDSRGLHYVNVERGEELQRSTTRDPKELAYWVFQDVTFWMGMDFEVKNRKELQDCRRMIYQKQLELLGELDDSWVEKTKRHHEAVLKEHPYDDFAGARADLIRQLRHKRHSYKEAEE